MSKNARIKLKDYTNYIADWPSGQTTDLQRHGTGKKPDGLAKKSNICIRIERSKERVKRFQEANVPVLVEREQKVLTRLIEERSC